METNATQQVTLNQQQQVSWRQIGKVIGWGIIIVVALKFWYIGIPSFVAWYLFKKRKNKFSQRTNIIATAIVLVIFIGAGIVSAHANRKPTFTINEPQTNSSIQAKTVTVKGKVSPSGSIVTVNNALAQTDKDGHFIYVVILNDESNGISVAATNGGKAMSRTLTVKRVFTPEEVVGRERLKAESEAKKQAQLEAQQKVKAESEAKAKAEQVAYEKSKAGQLCKQHPTWTKYDCQGVADRKFWIGMSYDMLIALRGKPNHANPSNYGDGVRWQWCWNDRNPSCFYGSDDGIIDSYN